MSGKSINFDNKNIKKVIFIKTKNCLEQKTLMLVKYLSLKKSYMVQKMLLNTLLGIMMIMKLNRFIYKASTNDWICEVF